MIFVMCIIKSFIFDIIGAKELFCEGVHLTLVEIFDLSETSLYNENIAIRAYANLTFFTSNSPDKRMMSYIPKHY